MDDTLDALDLDQLRALLQVVKDSGAAAFRYRDIIEVSFVVPDEDDKPVGFVPKDKQAATLAAQAEAEDGQPGGTAYHRAFGGKLPTFNRAIPKDE